MSFPLFPDSVSRASDAQLENREQCNKLPETSGIYYAKRKGEILYIGKASTNLRREAKTRLLGFFTLGYPVEVHHIEFPPQHLNILEFLLIQRYKPCLNSKVGNKALSKLLLSYLREKTISEEELIDILEKLLGIDKSVIQFGKSIQL